MIAMNLKSRSTATLPGTLRFSAARKVNDLRGIQIGWGGLQDLPGQLGFKTMAQPGGSPSGYWSYGLHAPVISAIRSSSDLLSTNGSFPVLAHSIVPSGEIRNVPWTSFSGVVSLAAT